MTDRQKFFLSLRGLMPPILPNFTQLTMTPEFFHFDQHKVCPADGQVCELLII
jgi:hypothetical protein